jgi:hypothetical protein
MPQSRDCLARLESCLAPCPELGNTLNSRYKSLAKCKSRRFWTILLQALLFKLISNQSSFTFLNLSGQESKESFSNANHYLPPFPSLSAPVHIEANLEEGLVGPTMFFSNPRPLLVQDEGEEI